MRTAVTMTTFTFTPKSKKRDECKIVSLKNEVSMLDALCMQANLLCYTVADSRGDIGSGIHIFTSYQ